MRISTEVTERALLDTAPAWTSVLAAFRTGLLEALLEESGTVSSEEFARRLGLVPEATELTLEVLAAYGLAESVGGEFGPSEWLLRYGKESPGGLGLHLGLSDHVEEFLRSGTPFLRMDGTLEERQSTYRHVAPNLRPIFEELSAVCADELAPVEGEILDVGAGSGVWSLALAERSPGAVVTALDLPEVADRFRAEAADRGLAERVRIMPGDYHTAPVPEHRYELVVLGNILHLESPDRARQLVRRMWRAVRPGGQLAVVDTLRGGDASGSRIRAMYALVLAMRAEHGRVHRRVDVERWLVEAGAEAVRTLPVPPGTERGEFTDILVASTASTASTDGSRAR